MMYYYKRKSNPFKWVIVVLIFMAAGALIYWFYSNYFSKIELNKPVEPANLNTEEIVDTKIINGEISLLEGDVRVDIDNKGYETAIDKAVLHQGDKIKTGIASLAVLNLSDGTAIRLGDNTEIVLNKLEENNVLVEILRGRIYNNIKTKGQYQILALRTRLISLGTKFEVIVNDKLEYIAALVMENNVKLEVLDNFENAEVLLSSRLDTNEKAIINLKAVKKDILKIETFDPKILAKESWYKWNFELDKGETEDLPEQEPDFEVVNDSLVLKAEVKDMTVKLTWSIYDKDNFQAYKIVRSALNSQLKYPEDELIKSSLSKEYASFTDSGLTKGKKYYYRVCVLKTSDKIACGNMVSAEIAEPDSVPPVAAQLSASVSVSGVNLSWTINNEEDFKEYRILKSITDSSLSFPSAGYLAKRTKGSENYLDKEVNITSPGNVYYRVCSLDMAQNSSCSNVIWVENGQVR